MRRTNIAYKYALFDIKDTYHACVISWRNCIAELGLQFRGA